MSKPSSVHSSFVEFYDSNQIMPVRQDLSDPNFKDRRMFLYRTLGVPLEFLSGKKVLEFGPGGGFNAHALTSFGSLDEYVCVEGSKVGEEWIKNFYFDGKIAANKFQVVKCDFLDFQTEKTFDLVIAEACIPGQTNPAATLSHISKYVKESGYLIITCTSMSSQLSEILRSVYSLILETEFNNTYLHQKYILREFEKHLKTLKTTTRTTEDWVADNISHKWHSRKADFSLVEALQTLPKFEFLHSNPQFFIDLNWYKLYSSKESNRNLLMIKQYLNLDILMLDMRIELEQVIEIHPQEVQLLSSQIAKCYESARGILINGVSENTLQEFAYSLTSLSQNCEKQGVETHRALYEYVDFLNSKNKIDKVLVENPKWWGRGQIYASLYRPAT